MSTKYKLQYFEARGLGECSRWLFAYAGVAYEDVRFKREQWAEKKQSMPFQQMPVLDVTDDSGKVTRIPESHAIERYLASEFGLMGKSNLESARINSMMDFIMSLIMKLPFLEKDEEKKKKLRKEALDGPISEGLSLLEGYIQGSGILIGDSITVFDILFSSISDFILEHAPNLLDKTPKLKAIREKVRNEPKIAQWIAKRPPSDF